ncbi:MAG: ParA family protein [Steroidobacteraceae bacterium]|jgi:cellulose biosynthesis protein BcsQ|nr:ParA family protein [Steroidobacteraceae bacterium]
MKTLAVSSIKGGVGKTTAAVNLAYLASQAGWRTVLWDLDPQGGATYVLRGEPDDRAAARRLVSGKIELPEIVASTAWEGLDLIPADFSYRNFDVHLDAKKHPTRRLLRMSRPLQQDYDLLVLDCPPGASLLTENVLRAADAIAVPTLPSPLSLRMIGQLFAFVDREGWTDLRLLPFFSMVDRRKSLHEQLVAEARERFPMLLATEIPYWSDIERMSVRRAPLPSFAPASEASRRFADLWQEVASRLDPLEGPGRPSAK